MPKPNKIHALHKEDTQCGQDGDTDMSITAYAFVAAVKNDDKWASIGELCRDCCDVLGTGDVRAPLNMPVPF